MHRVGGFGYAGHAVEDVKKSAACWRLDRCTAETMRLIESMRE